ncbi:PWWP domain-containing protein 2A-like [Anguilla rostrata]|uniref:PWWP domain-containing protein 2A-like n=1 Tax=Anguilla rostrata TaxID=7938 RepID=UPI0030D19CC9
MAAVAAEPGASAALTTTAGDGAELEPEIEQPVAAEAKLEAEATKEFSPVMDLVHLPKNGEAPQGCDLVHAESRRTPGPDTAGNALFDFGESEHILAANRRGSEPTDHESETGAPRDLGYAAGSTNTAMPPTVDAANEVHSCVVAACLGPAFSSESAAGASHIWESVPNNMLTETELAAPLPALAGLVVPAAEYTLPTEPDLVQPTRLQCESPAIIKASAETGQALESGDAAPLCGTSLPEPAEDVVPKCPGTIQHSAVVPVVEDHHFLRNEEDEIISVDFTELRTTADRVPTTSEPEGLLARDGMYSNADGTESELKPAVTGVDDAGLCPESIAQLIPGSEVRVALDHIIDDALVVSFRLGERIFSGVLMDLSKRFGPYGIPVTVYPKRESRDKPESMQPKTESLPSEPEREGSRDVSEASANEPPQAPAASGPAPNQRTSKPPPLFQEGAPYPPPLFIRDTYSQSIPQPPPRRIKRPKRKLYREEPTSIMSAIRLRPRQVLCDKCKGAVATGDKRELRKGPASDCRGDEAKRRRGESAAAVAKRPRAEERGRAAGDGARRPTPLVRVAALGQAKGGGVGNSAVKAATAAAASSPAGGGSRVPPHAKKVLQSKNVDHSETGEPVKRRARDRDRRGDKGGKITGRAPSTRASCPRDAHQKVHFTRRRHQLSGGGRAHANPLPPRIRIKPQRYRNEENDDSSCKPLPGFDKAPGSGSRSPPKLAPPSCTSTRSFSSSSSSFSGEPTAATENQGSTQEFGPQNELRLQPQPHSQPHPNMEAAPQPLPDRVGEEPEVPGGRDESQEKPGAKAANITVYMTLNPSKLDSSNVSVCSVDSTDDLKSSNSECSSTETFDFPPPGALHSPPAPSTSSVVTTSSTSCSASSSSSSSSSCSSSLSSSSSSAPKEEKKPSKSLKAAVFSKNVSKCVTTDGRTICVGDIVWAKIYGFPWWPARILLITVSRKDNGLLVRQEARISWFGSPTTSFLALSQVTPFLENFQLRFDKKRKGLYRKAITEAAKAAKQLTPEVRALLTQFET